jgi:lipopolysaccharide/colanic/teichoic acid biosynthesis glycosyltransferase
MVQKYRLKRVLDIVLASLGIVISSPLWLIISAGIFIEDRKAIFFLQERCGKNGKAFEIIKFRTMKHVIKNDDPHRVIYIENDPRVTGMGKVLRITAMDELPCLLNILKGEMSFVGPKPLPFRIDNKALMAYDSITEVPGYETRIKVRPGLTGLAQVYAPKVLDHAIRFRYDNEYIEKMSLGFDLKLIILSFWITFKGKWENRGDKI